MRIYAVQTLLLNGESSDRTILGRSTSSWNQRSEMQTTYEAMYNVSICTETMSPAHSEGDMKASSVGDSTLLRLSLLSLAHLNSHHITDHSLRQKLQGPGLHRVLIMRKHQRLWTANFIQTSSRALVTGDRPRHLVCVARRRHIADDESEHVDVIDVVSRKLIFERRTERMDVRFARRVGNTK